MGREIGQVVMSQDSLFLPKFQLFLEKCFLNYCRPLINIQSPEESVWKHVGGTRLCSCEGFPGGMRGGEPACKCRRPERGGFSPGVQKTPWRRAWQPPPAFLPGKSMGRGACWAVGHGVAESTWLEQLSMRVPRWLSGKESACKCRRCGFRRSQIRKILWKRKWQPTQYPCQENPTERSLVGCGWWGHKESDTTKRLTLCLCNNSVFLESLFSFTILGILFWWNKSQFTWNEEVHCFGPAIIFVARWNLL